MKKFLMFFIILCAVLSSCVPQGIQTPDEGCISSVKTTEKLQGVKSTAVPVTPLPTQKVLAVSPTPSPEQGEISFPAIFDGMALTFDPLRKEIVLFG